MTQFATRFASAATPRFTQKLGEAVLRYPGGDLNGTPENVTALVAHNPESRDDDRGQGFLATCDLTVEDSVTTDRDDAWQVNGAVWHVESIDVAELGWKVVHLVKRELVTSTSDRRTNRDR